MDFGALLRRCREQQGVTQEALAIRAGTSQAAISDIERGRVSPTIETAERLLLCLGLRLSADVEPLPMDASLESLMEAQGLEPRERLERLRVMTDFMTRGRQAAQEAGAGHDERP